MDKNIFQVIAPTASLEQCIAECNAYLSRYNTKVEVGGVLIGTFDGTVITVKRFLFDEKAQCYPASIYLSPDIFKIAEEEVEIRNRNLSGERYFIIGTWHTHPNGIDTYSSTDETMLFRDRMRIMTDDPGLAFAPWVHFIFHNYGIDHTQVHVFTMKLRSEYKLDNFDGIDKVNRQLLDERIRNINMGLLVSKPNGNELSIDRYHPNIFEMHREGRIFIRGLWKYYPFERITPIFEKVFLENFFQKIVLENFVYIRFLHNQNVKDPKIEWLKCKHSDVNHDISKIIEFKEIKIHTEDFGGRR